MTAVAAATLSLWFRLRGFALTTLLVHVPEATRAAAVLGAPQDGDTPPHVTIAYPFTRSALGATTSRELARLFAEHASFELELHTVRRFDDVAYLAPRDPESFAVLAEAVQRRFPGNPLYGGMFESYIPHLALGPVPRLTTALQSEVEHLLPIRTQVREVELWGLHRRRWALIKPFPLAI